MNTTLEAFEFIDSNSVREHVIQEYKADRFLPTMDDLLSIVWNSNSDIDMKQAYFMSLSNDTADDMVKRFEAVRNYIQQKHKNEVYVLIVNDKFYGVYKLFSSARGQFAEIADMISEDADIALEMYNSVDSSFRGRIKLDHSFAITSFDFSYKVIKEEKLWDNEKTDEIARRYVKLPHPFMVGDIVSRPGDFNLYMVMSEELPDPLDEEADEGELNYADAALLCRVYTDEEEDKGLTYDDLSDEEKKNPEDKEMIMVTELELD